MVSAEGGEGAEEAAELDAARASGQDLQRLDQVRQRHLEKKGRELSSEIFL